MACFRRQCSADLASNVGREFLAGRSLLVLELIAYNRIDLLIELTLKVVFYIHICLKCVWKEHVLPEEVREAFDEKPAYNDPVWLL